MSYQDGLAALNLHMPDRVPRTEYSAEEHWELVKKVTGIPVTSESPLSLKQTAKEKFIDVWNYDFIWNILIDHSIFDGKYTKMGHANYATNDTDFDSTVTQLFTSPEEALKFDPWALYGERNKSKIIKDFDDNYALKCSQHKHAVNMTGIYVSCMSGLIDIFGWDTLLCATGIDADGFGEVTNRYVSWISQYFEALAECKSPVVMIHDDIVWTTGAFIHPDWYRKYIFPNYKKLFQPLIESGKKIIYTSDGTYTQFIDDIGSCGVNGFVLEPTTDMKQLAEKYGKTHVIIGNADTRILLNGTKEDIYNEVKRCMDIGKKCPGYFMAVGNHIPSNTPVDNALYYNEYYELLSKR